MWGLREALMIKVLPKELSKTMNDCIHIVNFVKARALNSLFLRCYVKKWDQNINHCYFIFMSIGFFQEAINIELLTDFMLDLAQEHLAFSQLIQNNMAESGILFLLMLKCQRKNYPYLSEKTS